MVWAGGLVGLLFFGFFFVGGFFLHVSCSGGGCGILFVFLSVWCVHKARMSAVTKAIQLMT